MPAEDTLPATLPITDQDIITRVGVEARRRGDKKLTQTATKLILERLTQLESHGSLAREALPGESLRD